MGDDEQTDQTEHPGDEASEQFEQKPSEDTIREIEEERERRLDPDNRPDNAEVDNTGKTLPTVEEFKELNADDDEAEGSAGTADPAEKFREIEVSEEEQREIADERERRLDPDNRPDNAEVDNTGDNMPDIAKDDNQPD